MGRGETVSSARPQPGPGGCPTWLTLDILRVIDDKVVVPHHRQVHRQVADVIALIGILWAADREVRPHSPRGQVGAYVPLLATFGTGCWE